MASEPTPLLILGLGNVLCSDDGAGVMAVHRLRARYAARPDVEILDGGTLGLSLLPILRGARQVILVDAVNADAPIGTIVRLEGEAVTAAACERLSVHQIGVADLLNGARLLGGLPSRVVLVGVVPAHTNLGVELSPAVGAALDALVAVVADTAGSLGFSLEEEGGADATAVPHSLADALGLRT